jgi:MarC family integral membrane protein
MRIGFELFSPPPPGQGSGSSQTAEADSNVAFVPLAMPLMFGPGVIATILGMAASVKHSDHEMASFLAILLAILREHDRDLSLPALRREARAASWRDGHRRRHANRRLLCLGHGRWPDIQRSHRSLGDPWVEDAALTRALNGRASGGPVRTVKRGQSLKVSRSCSLLAGVNGRLVKEKATGSELASQAGFGGGTFR